MDRRSLRIWVWLGIILAGLAARAGAEPLSAEIRLSQDTAYVGEAVTMQIVVSGSESPDQPDLAHLEGLSVAFQGGSRNSSRSISIVNGRMTQEVEEGYVFSYQLTPLRAGRILIPPITIRAGSHTTLTRKAFIIAEKPAETAEFKLTMALSSNHCYVGEPVILTVTWYISREIETATLSLPFLEDKDRLMALDPRIDTSVGGPYYKIPAGSGEVIVEKGQGELDGRPYATLSFRKILVPRTAGVLDIAPASVSFKALTGYRQRRNPFGDDFFSGFFNDRLRQGMYRQGTATANALALTVQDLPAQGRPADFSGLVGDYRIETSATPLTVNVGDPVTLTVAVSGPEFPDLVELPPLQRQPDLVRDFKVPSDMAAGELSGKRKVFTQTIRPLRADVTAVPPLLLSCFNPRTGTYETVRSAPIPLTVNPTRVMTATDAEGLAMEGPAGSTVESRAAGIAHNYEGDGVFKRQIHDPVCWALSPAGLATLGLPPVFYLFLAAGTWVWRRKQADPGATLARKAGARFSRKIDRIRKTTPSEQAAVAILEAFKTYLREKFRLHPGALTFHDAATLLSEKGAGPETLEALKSLFADGEAARFGKSAAAGQGTLLLETARNLVKTLERL